jgi:CheY-like chemotaxis protein
MEILLVEDNPGDVRLTQEALRDGDRPVRLQVVVDGEAALSYLRREDGYQDAPRPDLILLDLNLPKRDGRQVLEDVKSDPNLRQIPVVILTTSRAEQDIVAAYNLYANCYIQKPVDLNQFLNIVRAIEDFWLTIVALPPAPKAV